MIDESILALFNCSKEPYLSGEDIARRLGVSRTAIWNHIDSMRKAGYSFEAVPHLGYRLVSVPDRLYPELVRLGLGTETIGRRVYYYDSVSSTNDVADHMAGSISGEGMVIIAESQEKGRGRMGRAWHSREDVGIWMSMILKPKISPRNAAQVTLACAVAVAEAIRTVSGLEARIKWPNDVVIRDKKVCGILVESRSELDELHYVIVGVGINVNHLEPDFPEELRETATSLCLELGKPVSRLDLLREILRKMEHREKMLNEGSFDRIIADWKEFSSTFGRRVVVAGPQHSFEGAGAGIGGSGEFLVRMDEGIMKSVFSGDVRIL